MTTKFLINSLSLKNWGPFRNQTLNFSTNSDKNVTIITGLNGTGKTFLFDAINWVLFETSRIEPSQRHTILNKYAQSENDLESQIIVKCTIIDERGNRVEYNIIRTMIFEKKKEILSLRKNEFSGLKKIQGRESKNINEEEFTNDLEKSIPSAVRKFYFLDGERLAHLFQPGTLEDVKELAIKLSDIPILEVINDILIKYQKKIATQIDKTSGTDEMYQRKNEELEKIKEEYNVKIQKLNEYDNEIKNSEKEVSTLYSQLETYFKHSEILKKINEMEKNIKNDEDELKTMNINLDKLLEENFSLLLLENGGILKEVEDYLEDKRQKGEIPAPISEALIDFIKLRGICICERPLDERIKELLDNKREIVPTDQLNRSVITFIEELKKTRRDLNEARSMIKEKYSIIITKNEEIGKKKDDLEEEKAKIPKSVIDKTGRKNWEAYEKYRVMLESLNSDRNRLKHEIENMEKEIDKRESELKKIYTRISKVSKSDVITKNQIVLKILKEIKRIKDKISSNIREYLGKRATEIFKLIIWNPDSWSKIETNEDWKIDVISAEGYRIRNISMGQSHVLGIAFMTSLSDFTNLQIPFVFDSPFGRISEEPIHKIGKNLPTLLHGSQIILTVTDTEKDNIYKSIENSIGMEYYLDNIKLETIIKQISN